MNPYHKYGVQIEPFGNSCSKTRIAKDWDGIKP